MIGESSLAVGFSIAGPVWMRHAPAAFSFPIVSAIAAWAGLLALGSGGDLAALCFSEGTPTADIIALGLRVADFDWFWVGIIQLLMIFAMMAPLSMTASITLSARSYPADQLPLVAAFFAGYMAIWIGFGALVAAPLALFGTILPLLPAGPVIGALGCLLAALWHLSPLRSRLLARAHPRLLTSPTGDRAAAKSGTWGLVSGWHCLAPCAPTMLLVSIGGHDLTALLVTSAILWAERTRRRPRQIGAAILLCALGLLRLSALV